jgi:hypothetical protein
MKSDTLVLWVVSILFWFVVLIAGKVGGAF